MLSLFVVMLVGSLPGGTPDATAAPPTMIEVESNKTVHKGRVLASSGDLFWMLEQDGRIRELDVKSTSKFRQVAPKYEPLSPLHVGSAIRREIGETYAVVTTRRYAVAATSEARARRYAEILDDTYRAFQAYFSVRGLSLVEPECPLPVMVFANASSFAAYAKQDNVPVSRGLRGYYHPFTNRVALFEEEQVTAAMSFDAAPLEVAPLEVATRETSLLQDAPFSGVVHRDSLLRLGTVQPRSAPFGTLAGDLKDTLVHEAVHQAAFNMRLHSRLGHTPRWVCEGLATVFEAPGIRNSSAGTSPKMRINPERLTWFGSYAQQRRKPKSLRGFLESDQPFNTNTLDAYSEAWALSFYLIEKRPREYAKYLARVARRDPLQLPTPAERVRDFEETISRELPLLEAEVLRYVQTLNK